MWRLTRAGCTWPPSRTPRDRRLEHHLRSSLCENALMMAIGHRAPPQGLIHHSDRGVQYACGPYRKILDRHGIKMSRKGDCYEPVRVSEATTHRWSHSSALAQDRAGSSDTVPHPAGGPG